jgi:hypothetical protein
MRVLLLVCVSLILRAQSDTQQKFTVSGTVVNAMTNEPVRGALVTLSSNQPKTALSGPDGHFQIDGVAASSAQIMAQRPGFDQQNMRQQRIIKIDSDTEGVTVKIMPLSRISGRIVDREGEPIEGVSVQCITQQIVNGRKQWQPRGGVSSDEAGSFVIEDLNAGTYILRTQEKQLYFTAPQSEAARYIYPPTFYPDAATREQAQHIDLTAGQDMKVDIALNSIRGSRVTVRTVPPYANVIASMSQDDDQLPSNQARAGKSGDLTFPAVAPGNWKIEARGPFSGGNNEQPMYGQLEVQVGTVDLDNLKVPMGKMADIPVTITGVQSPQVALQLLSKDGNIAAGSNPEPNGQMLIRSVAPGTYRLIVPFTGSNNCIKSIMSGSQDLMRDQLVVSVGASVPPIQVVESNNCAQLTINTNSKDNTWVLVASESGGFEPRLLSGMGSGYTAEGLPDGDYKVCAFDDITDLEYTNPEVLREFKCQSAHLEAGQKSNVQVEVNERLPK